MTSARGWIKQRDFENCYLLERLADPLAALAGVNAPVAGLEAYLDLAWHYQLQNHPHDSICGCSVDQVHRDMRYRFDQAELIARGAIRQASAALLAREQGGGDAVAVFNPSFTRKALVSGEVRLADGGAGVALVGDRGRRTAAAIEATRPGRARLCFVADDLEPAGFSFYRIVSGEAACAPAGGGDSIENAYFRLWPSPRGLGVEDKRTASRMELYFEDDGDRGDEYNFDHVHGDRPISSPAALDFEVVEAGPVRQRLRASLRLRVARELAPDRSRRGEATTELPITLVATLYAGLDRIDFEATVDNRACDHRLRAALSTPVAAREALADTSFAVIARPLVSAEPAGTEHRYPTAPHRTFTAVEGEALSVALVGRGLLEAEVRPEPAGSTILLTLLRCVGWLSRSDLGFRRGGAGPELPTPEAQQQGGHRFEFCLISYRGGYLRAEAVQGAQAYAYPPRLLGAPGGALPGRRLALGACDNGRVLFSTARPCRPEGSYRLRAWSISPEREPAGFSFPPRLSVRLVDLAGRPQRQRRLSRAGAGRVELELRPFEIVTFELRRRRR